jgi:hypothetical protein
MVVTSIDGLERNSRRGFIREINMSVDYRGRASTGYLSRVTSVINGKKYNVSTAQKGIDQWETAILNRGFLGMFRPLICIRAPDEQRACWTHNRFEEIAEQHDPSDWNNVKLKLVSDAVRLSTAHEDIMSSATSFEATVKFAEHWILGSLDQASSVAASLQNKKSTLFSGEILRQARVETAAFLLFYVQRFAFTKFGEEFRDVFMEVLIINITDRLQAEGIDPNQFEKLLIERFDEYNDQKWWPDKGEGRKGTLYWEFCNRIADIFGPRKDIMFNALLENSLLTSIAGFTKTLSDKDPWARAWDDEHGPERTKFDDTSDDELIYRSHRIFPGQQNEAARQEWIAAQKKR